MDADTSMTPAAPLTLVLTENDFPVGKVQQIRARAQGVTLLGDEDSTRALFDALPGAIANRVKQITPADFCVAEIQLKLVINGTICGLGLNGDVVVKLAPTPRR